MKNSHFVSVGKMSDATDPEDGQVAAEATDTHGGEEDAEGDVSGEKDREEEWVLTEEQKAACKTMFEKLSLYLNGELTG